MERSLHLPVRPPISTVRIVVEHCSRIITDRYALPAGADLNACDPKDQTWCGGTWNTIRENLDYTQNAGFTASEHPPHVQPRVH